MLAFLLFPDDAIIINEGASPSSLLLRSIWLIFQNLDFCKKGITLNYFCKAQINAFQFACCQRTGATIFSILLFLNYRNMYAKTLCKRFIVKIVWKMFHFSEEFLMTNVVLRTSGKSDNDNVSISPVSH